MRQLRHWIAAPQFKHKSEMERLPNKLEDLAQIDDNNLILCQTSPASLDLWGFKSYCKQFFYEKGRLQGKNRHYKDMTQLHLAVETGAHFI